MRILKKRMEKPGEATTVSDAQLARAREAIIRVGDGRGFLVESSNTRCPVVIVTAAHCLPHLPPPHPASYTEERTYANLLGPLGEVPTLWAECLFVDPVSDVALLRPPDNQELSDQAEAFDAFVAARHRLRVGGLPPQASAGWLLTLDGHWARCVADPIRPGTSPWLSIRDTEPQAVAAGTSGSPVLSEDGRVVALISTGSTQNPILASTLPLGLATEVLTQKAVVEIYRIRRRLRLEIQSQIRAL